MKIEIAKSSAAALKCGVAVSALLVAGAAYAQDTAPADDQTANASDIVVTGTLIRGIAPAGTNVIGVDSKKVEESGASSTSQLLQTVPQLGFFNNLQVPTGASTAVTTNRPNLRNLPGFNTSGSSPTLVLVDGHRVVGAGISVTSPDPDIVPPGMIERVEIVPDGGSAIYGSDAVAGVINFITRKKFDGIEVGGHFGFAHHYDAWDVSATAGHSWATGSIIASYNYAQHDQLVGRDLDHVFYPTGRLIGGNPVASLQCSPGNVNVGNVGTPATGTTIGGLGDYALNANGTRQGVGTANSCDNSDLATIYPREKRHSVMVGLNQQLTDNLTLDMRAFYTNRQNFSQAGPFLGTTNFGPSFLAQYGFLTSPIFDSNKVTTGACPTEVAPGVIFNLSCNMYETQTVNYQFGGDHAQDTTIKLETWGIAPTVTLKLGDNFQAKLVSSYGQSSTNYRGGTFDQTSLDKAIVAGLFNPYNPSASDSAALAVLSSFQLYGRTRQRQFNSRLSLDGDLFQLPGGAVKIAVGAEYSHEHFSARNGVILAGTEDTGFAGSAIVAGYGPLRNADTSRSVKSVFGELVVPVFGADNGAPGMQELTLSAAGRYDNYSDFGGTFNPKFGVTYRPVEWIKLRGSWGKSFVAPSLADQPAESRTSVTFTTIPFLYPAANLVGTTINGVTVPASGGRPVAIVLGNAPNIQPQRAKTLSLGIDLDPPFVPGLRLSTSYYKIIYSGAISIPGFTSTTFYPNFVGTPLITFNPTQSQIDAVIALAGGAGGVSGINGTSCGGNTPGGPAGASGGCYAILDARKTNLANFNLSGLDFAASYILETGFGSIDFAFNGTYELTRNQQATPSSPYLDQISFNTSRFRFRTTLGAQIGALRAQASLNHSGGYRLNPTVGVGTTQTSVSSYNTVDLFFKYDLKGEGALNGTSLTLNVNNLFDQDPPIYRALNELVPNTNGYTNGGTLGRFIQFGINKRF